MKVPNHQNIIIPVEKIDTYLLSRAHPIGKTKARFFESVGYSLKNRDHFLEDLVALVKENNVTMKMETEYGIKYIVKGVLGRRFGKSAPVVTVWLIEEGTSIPRFITAYPNG